DGFFFFQAEDGIRDKLVTGVQTCALPFSPRRTIQTRPLSTARCALFPAPEPEFEVRLFLSLPVRHERGESRREGLSKTKFLLSPTLPSLLRREEREKRPDVPSFRGTRLAQSPGRSLPEGEGQGEGERRGLASLPFPEMSIWESPPAKPELSLYDYER